MQLSLSFLWIYIQFMYVHFVKSLTFMGLTGVLWNPTGISSGCISSLKLQLLSALRNIWLSTLHFQYSICYCKTDISSWTCLSWQYSPWNKAAISCSTRTLGITWTSFMQNFAGTTQSLPKEKGVAAKWLAANYSACQKGRGGDGRGGEGRGGKEEGKLFCSWMSIVLSSTWGGTSLPIPLLLMGGHFPMCSTWMKSCYRVWPGQENITHLRTRRKLFWTLQQ